jgi:hypothetical protein
VRELCPSKAWLADYDCRAIAWRPFRSVVEPGGTAVLHLYIRNYRQETMPVAAAPALPEGWTVSPASRNARIPADAARRLRFEIQVPADARAGRYVLAAEVEVDGDPIGEAAIALVDIAE